MNAEHILSLCLNVGDDLILPAGCVLMLSDRRLASELILGLPGDLQLARLFLDIRFLSPNWLASANMLSPLAWCSGVIVPTLFPGHGLRRNEPLYGLPWPLILLSQLQPFKAS